MRAFKLILALAGTVSALSATSAATLQYFQATGQAVLEIGDSPSGKILGYVLTSNYQFFVDSNRSTSFGALSAPIYENSPNIIGDNDLSFNGTAHSIPLGQLFPSTLTSVDDLAASFTNRIYVPSLGGGEHQIKLQYIDLDGVAWDEPAPLPVLPPIVVPPVPGPIGPAPPEVFPPPPLPEFPPVVEAPPLPAPPGPEFIDPIIDDGPIFTFPLPTLITWEQIRSGFDAGRWPPLVLTDYRSGELVLTVNDAASERPIPGQLVDFADAYGMDLAVEPVSLFTSDAPAAPSEFALTNFTTTRTASPAIWALARSAAVGPDAQVVIPEPAADAMLAAALGAFLSPRRRRP